MEVKAKIVGGNVKLGNMGSFSTLYGDDVHYVEKAGLYVRGTCGGRCAGCKKACYVPKSYRYPSVVMNHANNTLALREDLQKAFEDMDGQLTRKRKKFKIVRINQSGELEEYEWLVMWVWLAQKHPETNFYIYTKAYDFVEQFLEVGEFPENFTLLVSIWHEIGVEEYKRLASHPSVKAFVYMDGFDYEALGIHVQTMCEAYKGGKLNHDITCEKCGKCIRQSLATKVIGCESH